MCIHFLLLINAYYKNVYLTCFFKYKNITKKYFFVIFLCNYIKLINLNNEYNYKVSLIIMYKLY